MKENSVINIIYNKVQTFFATNPTIERYVSLPFFQYFVSNSRVIVEDKIFLIIFYNNWCKQETKSNCFDY